MYESLEAGAKSAGQASFKVRVDVRGNVTFPFLDDPSASMIGLEHRLVSRYLKAAFLNQDAGICKCTHDISRGPR